MTSPSDLPSSLGALRASGYTPKTVKQELRDNLIAALQAQTPLFPGIVGYEDTVRRGDVLPAIGHPALLALGKGVFGLTPARQAWSLAFA